MHNVRSSFKQLRDPWKHISTSIKAIFNGVTRCVPELGKPTFIHFLASQRASGTVVSLHIYYINRLSLNHNATSKN